ncbi:MAG TPA: hypothetical protein VKQ32_11960 [Polyangia bacterium]|nr:hypothetical protein [Polyangia bacterium]
MRIGSGTGKANWTSLTSALAGAALSFAAAGCDGGGGPGGACGPAPCGGNVVGNWTGTSACVDPAVLSVDILTQLKGACPEVSLGAVSMTSTGTLAMGADMSFTGSLAVDSMIDVNYPAACLGGKTCDDLARTLQTIVGTQGITAITCAGSGSCVCTMVQKIPIVNASGTWATAGMQLTFAGAPGGDGPYCVQGSSLHLIGLDAATMTKVANDIVLTKQ